MHIYLIKLWTYRIIPTESQLFVSRETGQNDMINALVEANHALL